MSYSFNARGANKEAAKAAVAAEFEKVVECQTIHAKDKAAVLANAGAAIDLLADDRDADISVTCNGYLSWRGIEGDADNPPAIVSANVSCYATHVARAETPAA